MAFPSVSTLGLCGLGLATNAPAYITAPRCRQFSARAHRRSRDHGPTKRDDVISARQIALPFPPSTMSKQKTGACASVGEHDGAALYIRRQSPLSRRSDACSHHVSCTERKRRDPVTRRVHWSRARQRRDLIGCSATGTVGALSVRVP